MFLEKHVLSTFLCIHTGVIEMINNKAKLNPRRQLFGPYFLTKNFLIASGVNIIRYLLTCIKPV